MPGVQAFGDHRPVTLLEDVQRHDLAGQRDEFQGKEREVARDLAGHLVR